MIILRVIRWKGLEIRCISVVISKNSWGGLKRLYASEIARRRRAHF